MKFKVGDRVRVYGWVTTFSQPYSRRGGGIGTVMYVTNDHHIHVEFDHFTTGESVPDNEHYQAHIKQCRRLVKKKRRRIWIPRNHLLSDREQAIVKLMGRADRVTIFTIKPENIDAVVEFIEAPAANTKKKEAPQ